MKNRLSRSSRGYIGSDFRYQTSTGVINPSKHYNETLKGQMLSVEYPNPYTPPKQWVSLPSLTGGDQKFVGVHTVWNDFSNFVALSATTSTGNYLVDWGDGTTGSFASNVKAEKQYTPTTYAGLTSEVYYDYKTILITITPITGNLTGVNLNQNHSQANLNSNSTKGWLNCVVAGSNISSMSWRGNLLEQIEFVGLNNITGMFAHFSNLPSLKKIVQYYTGKSTRFDLCFNGTTSLTTVPAFDVSSAADAFGLSQMFYGCFSLRFVPWMNTSHIKLFNGCFLGCNSLKIGPNWDLGNATNVSQMFVGCLALESIPLYNTKNCTNFSQMFQDCDSLVTIPPIDTSNGTNFGLMFYDAYLQSLPQIDVSKGTNFTSTFYKCNLKGNPVKLNCISGITFSGMFSNSGVEEVDLTTTENGLAFDTMFNSSGIQQVKGLCAAKGLNFSSMFSNAQQLTTLEKFEIPVSVTGASYATNAFQSVFSNNYNFGSFGMVDVSSLTGASYANVFSNMFLDNRSLRTIGLTGVSQNLNITGSILGPTALNDLYRSLAVVGASGSATKTITVTSNWGTASDDPSIAIAKGWAVTG
jgi:hypothetical protein